MARKKSRRLGSPSGKGSTSGARKPSKPARIVSRRDPWGKPVKPETRRKVFAAAAAVRRAEAKGEKLSLSKAVRQEGTTVAAFKQFPQLVKRTEPGEPLRVTKGDTYKRNVNIYIPLRYRDGDVRKVAVYSYKESQLASRYLTTVDKVRSGKLPPSALKEFEGATFGREKQPVLTDFAAIKRLSDAGIHIDEFYAEPGEGAS